MATSSGNQTCTLLSSGTLRLRVLHALAGHYGTHVAIPGIRFPYGFATTERPASERR